MTAKVLYSTWTYTVNGTRWGTYSEDYATRAFENLKADGQVTELIRVDHVASDFATTGLHAEAVSVVVASHGADEVRADLAASIGERAYDMAVVADEAAHRYDTEWDGHGGPYRRDAAYLLLGMLGAAQARGELAAVVRGFYRLADQEPHRVHRLLLSLKQDRTADVVAALVDY